MDSHTLTLSGINLQFFGDNNDNVALYLGSGITIVLTEGSENNISNTYGAGYSDVYSIYSGNLTIKGKGTLNVSCSNTDSDSSNNSLGISSAKLTIDGGTINVDSKTATSSTSYGIDGYRGPVTINGGTVTVNAQGGKDNYGIKGSALNINGGTVNVKGADATTGDSYGISCFSLTINDGNTHATSGIAGAGKISSAVYGSTKPIAKKVHIEAKSDDGSYQSTSFNTVATKYFVKDLSDTAIPATDVKFTPKPKITGSVTIDGESVYNQLLTATITSNLEEKFTYQRKEDGAVIYNATAKTYKIKSSSVGKKVSVEVSHDDRSGALIFNKLGPITKKQADALPGNITGVGCTTPANNDGQIQNVTITMQYRLVTDPVADWINCTKEGIDDYQFLFAITGLVSDKYEVRRIENAGTFAGYPKEIEIKAYTKKSPTKEDFSFSLTQVDYDDNPKSVSVMAKDGKNLGAITVKYAGSTTAPTDAGTYAITVDTAGSAEYNTVTGLSLGNFTINKIAYTDTTTVSTNVLATDQIGATVTIPALPTGASYDTPAAS